MKPIEPTLFLSATGALLLAVFGQATGIYEKLEFVTPGMLGG